MEQIELHIIPTSDGSCTLKNEQLNETYHSVHGAITESEHVFIRHGFDLAKDANLRILEIGFGTGLNALLTLKRFLDGTSVQNIDLVSIEKYPISEHIARQLKYIDEADGGLKELFYKMHSCAWNKKVEITKGFTLTKLNCDLLDCKIEGKYNLVYFDAFGPSKQEVMWQKHILEKVVSVMVNGGVFSTYCAKGQVRRDLTECGLTMSRVPGPPGKREILIGIK